MSAWEKRSKPFLSTPSGWRATTTYRTGYLTPLEFLSTPSGWRATTSKALRKTGRRNFYPRPPGGGRRICASDLLRSCHFYPRPPGGGRPQCVKRPTICSSYFYPRPPGGGRQDTSVSVSGNWRISIHALRVEGDFSEYDMTAAKKIFLSTPSGWRATRRRFCSGAGL